MIENKGNNTISGELTNFRNGLVAMRKRYFRRLIIEDFFKL